MITGAVLISFIYSIFFKKLRPKSITLYNNKFTNYDIWPICSNLTYSVYLVTTHELGL